MMKFLKLNFKKSVSKKFLQSKNKYFEIKYQNYAEQVK